MRRALFLAFMPLVTLLLAGLVPTVAHATHIEVPEISADCQHFEIDFRANYRSRVNEASVRVVVTLVDEDGLKLLHFETVEPLELTGDKYVYYHLSWIWNDITDDYIHLIGLTVVNCELTIIAPWGEDDRLDIHTVETSTHIVCDVVDDDDVSWGEIKSRYR
ncbi:hypothetical protein DRQ50_04810 [bacterium]|nr:MAG: hypothetical protein DRQ50_04810 [bacterium]